MGRKVNKDEATGRDQVAGSDIIVYRTATAATSMRMMI
jgi:hypothetical protein